jgi:hypothetical protein
MLFCNMINKINFWSLNVLIIEREREREKIKSRVSGEFDYWWCVDRQVCLILDNGGYLPSARSPDCQRFQAFRLPDVPVHKNRVCKTHIASLKFIGFFTCRKEEFMGPDLMSNHWFGWIERWVHSTKMSAVHSRLNLLSHLNNLCGTM